MVLIEIADMIEITKLTDYDLYSVHILQISMHLLSSTYAYHREELVGTKSIVGSFIFWWLGMRPH